MLTGIILAGGKSTRIGKDKAFITFQGKMLIEHSIALMQRICDEVIISANHPRYETFGLPVVPDNYPSIGPIGGLEASLDYSQTEHNLVISTDTPFVGLSVYYEILKALKGELSVVPRNGKNPEPLTAYYSKKLLPVIRQQIEIQNYKIRDLLKEARVKYVGFAQSDVFKNLNTRTDLVKGATSSKMNLSNMILIAGDGRAVGKTYLACRIINHLSSFNPVIGIKVSPHFHEYEDEQSIICKNERFVIIDEKAETAKDSSLMLQSGANRVFFIMAADEHLLEAISLISDQLLEHPIVCESGGLREVVQPGLFLFVRNRMGQIEKTKPLRYAPAMVFNHKKHLDFDPHCIRYEGNQVTLNLASKLG